MDPEKMRQCMSLGYSAKSKLTNTIGQHGNGLKTSTMRLGVDVIVFSRCPGKDGKKLMVNIITACKQGKVRVRHCKEFSRSSKTSLGSDGAAVKERTKRKWKSSKDDHHCCWIVSDVERALNVVEETERVEEDFVKEMEVMRRNLEPA